MATDLGTKTFSWNLNGPQRKTEHLPLPGGAAVDLTLAPSYDRRHGMFNVALDAAYTAGAAPVPTPVPTPTPTPTPTPSSGGPYSGAKVGARIGFLDFVNDPSAFGKISHSWFGGASQNGIATDPANVVQAADGIQLWKRNGKGASINTNPSDRAAAGYTFGIGYMEVSATISNIIQGAPTINYHGKNGANNGPSVSGNWLGAPHFFGEQRASTTNVYYDKTNERSFTVDNPTAPHYLICNVGLNGWSAIWSDGQQWPLDDEEDDFEDYGPGAGAPDGLYMTVHSATFWAAA